MDTIHIANLAVQTHIGVPDEEREEEQKLHVSVWLETDTHAAGASDDVTQSIDYAAVAGVITELAKTQRKTIEKFAEDTANAILKDFAPEKVTVNIIKYALPETDHVAITITRP